MQQPAASLPAWPGTRHLLGQKSLVRDLAKRGNKERKEAKNIKHTDTDLANCHGLKDRCLPRKAGTPLEWENTEPFPSNYYNFGIKGLPGKDMGKRIPVLY